MSVNTLDYWQNEEDWTAGKNIHAGCAALAAGSNLRFSCPRLWGGDGSRESLAARRRYIGEMVDHAIRKGVKSNKPALGVTP